MTAYDPPDTRRLTESVTALRNRPIAGTEKGFGGVTDRSRAADRADSRRSDCGRMTAAGLAARRPALFGGAFDMPVLVLREAAVRQNIESMAAYCAAAGVLHAPHAKTTMAPQLIARQLAAGAWAVTAATIAQVRVLRAFGAARVLIANELTDRPAVEWLASELAADPGFECYAYVDADAGARLLDEVMRALAPGRRLAVLVELGYPGGRTGCRTISEALAVAAAVESAAGLQLAGAAGYEGVIKSGDEAAATGATLGAVAAFCRELATLGGRLPGFPRGQRPILSAGGSAYFDLVVRELTAGRPGAPDPVVMLRSGAYVTHGHRELAAIGPGSRPGSGAPEFAPALELWASVLSVPEPGLAILNAGRRDISSDQGMPMPLRVRRTGADGRSEAGPAPEDMRVTDLNDQHAYLHLPACCRISPGDLVCLGSTHPCTTFDKWRVIPVVDSGDRVIDAVHTFF